VAFESFFGGIPVRPFLLAVDHGHTGPAKSFAADGNSITPRLSTALHVIEVMVQWIHNDGTARLSRGVLNVCPAVGWIDTRQTGRRARAAGEKRHRGGRSTRNQDTTAQNAHIIKLEPTRIRNQETLLRSIPAWRVQRNQIHSAICGCASTHRALKSAITSSRLDGNRDHPSGDLHVAAVALATQATFFLSGTAIS
jgi:hypothetical protein